MLKVILLLILTTSIALADTGEYWSIKIPTMNGATDVSTKREKRFYTMSLSYDLALRDTDGVYAFYDKFFGSLGWEDETKTYSKNSNEFQGKWSSYRSSFNNEGNPESVYASMWKSKAMPAAGTVRLTLTGYNDGVFTGNVVVTIAPQVDTSPLFNLNKLMMGDPKNVFILHKAIGGNPFEIDKVNSRPTGKYKNNAVVKEYYKIVGEIINQYRAFGSTYIAK